MHDDKAYFRVYGEKVRAKSKAPKAGRRHAPEWFNYEVDALCDMNPLKQVLNVGGVPVSLKNDKEGFIRNIKKTRPQQIKYLLEDMDEEVRRLKNAVLYVGFCHRQYKAVLQGEEHALDERMGALQKVLRQSECGPDSEPGECGGKSSPGRSGDSSDLRAYTIAPQMSNATKADSDPERTLVVDAFSEAGNEAIREADCAGKGNYLLRQLQRQLLEMNNKLKVLKLEFEALSQDAHFQELASLKRRIREQKQARKAHMLRLHKLNEKFLEKHVHHDKVARLDRRAKKCEALRVRLELECLELEDEVSNMRHLLRTGKHLRQENQPGPVRRGPKRRKSKGAAKGCGAGKADPGISAAEHRRNQKIFRKLDQTEKTMQARFLKSLLQKCY